MKTVFTLLFFSLYVQAQDLNSQRVQWILNTFNSKPDSLIEPLTQDQIELGDYEGRVMVNKKAKLSYYIHIEEKSNSQSKITLIPMATSRFAPNYYQTDEWWEKHKNEKPMPKQDPTVVLSWLNEMKLSTDPDVVVIEPAQNNHSRISLKEYLLNVYLENFVENGKVILYRGAEKPFELDSWKKRQMPNGIRYWTPTANYAWRYARKNKDFLDLLIKNQTPLFRFEIPVADFKEMVLRRWPLLTLGTELTKNAHSIFNSQKYFGDHLFSSQPYLGIGNLGVEFEVRSNRAGALQMVNYFVRAATIDDLAQDRTRVLKQAKLRLAKQKDSTESDAQFDKRIEAVETERQLLKAIIDQKPHPHFQELLSRLSQLGSELTLIDGVQIKSWAQKQFVTIGSCRDVVRAE